MKEQTPDAVVALAAEHNIHFLPRHRSVSPRRSVPTTRVPGRHQLPAALSRWYRGRASGNFCEHEAFTDRVMR